ncbi:protein kinase domain containing protein, partial [Entamoeba invadens IP1]
MFNCFLLQNGLCVSDATCLIVQFDGKCQICNTNNGYINNNGICVEGDVNSEVTTNYNVVSCKVGYVLHSTNCLKCNEIYTNSDSCENGKATKCDNTSEIDTNGMCNFNDCVIPNNENGKCTTTIDNCIYQLNGICNECESKYILYDNVCKKNKEPNCIVQNSFGCWRCQDTYYLDIPTKQCKSCNSSCSTCFETSTKCLSCPQNTYLSNYKCNTNEDLKMRCKHCLTCNSTNYKTNGGDCLPQ